MAYEMSRGLPPELAKIAAQITAHARSYGLDFWEICFELLDYDELNEVASYGGFPTRFPHWKWGMEFEQLSKSYGYGLSKIYELVINNDPCYAYLMKSNSLVDQKLVISHVCGHADFFKNNLWFAHTNRKMIDQMANHGTRIRRYAERYGHDEVEQFVDACLSIDNLIDMHSPYIKRRREKKPDEETSKSVPRKLRSKPYMDRFINPPEFMEEQQRKLEDAVKKSKEFPENPERDVLLFLIEHAQLERWQRDVLGMVREEAYYFAPQAMTKVLNEGWACLAPDTLTFTSQGLVTMREVVEAGAIFVADGEGPRAVVDRHVIPDHPTVTVRTRRGLRLTGSNNHRVLLPDGQSWKRLDELSLGDRLLVSGGAGIWPEHEVGIEWVPDVSNRPFLREVPSAGGGTVAVESRKLMTRRTPVVIPGRVTPELGAFLGYLVGDGHISRVKRNLGLTTGDLEQAERFARLTRDLFALEPRIKKDVNRYRVLIHSETLADFLTEGLGLTHGPSARHKHIPDVILRSPEPVVREFLRAYFDCDGHGGKQGVILATSSDVLGEQTQLLLLNYGILTRRRPHKDGCWHIHAAGASAARYAERIGFGLRRKQEALETHLERAKWFCREKWEDEVVSLERGRGDVYDITVEETHRYAAAGFVNHNSFWHSKLMTEKVLKDDEVIDYADRHAGTTATQPGVLNPYKLGIELLRDIEERWNKGKFGKEWEECDDAAKKRTWDLKLGKGREKVFEVRRIYNDVLFIDEFLTEEFAREQKLFTFEFSKQTGEYVIASREFKQVKQKLLDQLTNWGNPVIFVENGNYENRGELYMKHRHEGLDLRQDHAKDTLKNVQLIWGRPVHLETIVDKRRKVLTFNGRKHSERTL